MRAAGLVGTLAGLPAGTAAAQPAPAGMPVVGAPAPRAATGRAAKPETTKPRAAKGEAAKGKPGEVKPGKAAAGEPPPPWMSVDPDRAARPDGAPAHKAVVSHAPSGDPVEIGGKWNGSNESSARTRAENYNGDAAGTGGSVGLKLHF